MPALAIVAEIGRLAAFGRDIAQRPRREILFSLKLNR